MSVASNNCGKSHASRYNSALNTKPQTFGEFLLPPSMRPRRAIQVAIFLLIVLALELCISGRQQSQTFDEADHIFAGYRYWKCLDFSANPEHPPMLKLLAAVPLLTLDLQTPPLCSVSRNDFLDARTFLYSNDADSILFRTRLFASLFTLALAVLLFGAGLTIFGPEVAVLALAIFVFEPTILAHGFLVTTDMAVTCCLFASVVAFYFYLEKRSTRWLVATGIATGMTLAAKHSGLLVIPILTALAAVDVFSGRTEFAGDQNAPSTKRFAWIARSSLAILLIAYVTLWCFYGFRFKSASPPANDFVAAGQLASDSSVDRNAHSRLLRTALRMHILPEPYLYGLRHVAAIARTGGPAFIFGKLYPSGRWYYFPAVLLVKWTVGFILLLAASSLGISGLKPQNRRALWFLALPPLIFLAACLPAKLNLGVRHILPVFPFVIVIAAAGAWELCRHRPAAKYVVAALVLAHAASSMASFPSYIPYSNELFGGTSHTYRVLGESNVDWGQSLKAIRGYVQRELCQRLLGRLHHLRRAGLLPLRLQAPSQRRGMDFARRYDRTGYRRHGVRRHLGARGAGRCEPIRTVQACRTDREYRRKRPRFSRTL